MASNDQWPPVASTGKGAVKANGNKRNIKDLQQKVLKQVTEMFGSAVESKVILTVVQNCNWELQPSIEGLITLTETVDEPLIWNNPETADAMTPSVPLIVEHPLGLKGGSLEDSKSELVAEEAPELDLLTPEQIAPPKAERPKKSVSKNRMDAFCGNIAKLKSSVESGGPSCIDKSPENAQKKQKFAIKNKTEILFDDILNYGSSGLQIIPKIPEDAFEITELPDLPIQIRGHYPPAGFRPHENFAQSSKFSNQQQENSAQSFSDVKLAAENFEFNKSDENVDSETKISRKSDTESRLCGLKVQYRIGGMESSSDDDADVVIEDESSDYEINLEPSIPINVSQFLSIPTETPPKPTQPEFQMISTPSPPHTPQRDVHQITLDRIKSSIEKGYKIMILLRGLPGSGKTTLAKSIVATTIGGNPSAYVFNTDDFFVTLGRGLYQFDPTRLEDAHNTNQKRVSTALKEGRSPVIVDNTNTEAWEMKPYVQMAVERGYIVEILEPNTPWAKNINELAKKNNHNVPKMKIRERSQRYETIKDAEYLLHKFRIKYPKDNKPPQMREIPVFAPPPQKPIRSYFPTYRNNEISTLSTTEADWDDEDTSNYILSSHDIEMMQNIDETHSTIGCTSELASIATDSSETSSNPEKAINFKDQLNNYSQELPDSDDESFEMLGGSGSDNLSITDINGSSADTTTTDSLNQSHPKVSNEENAEESSAGKTKEPNSINSTQIFGAIGSERKGSIFDNHVIDIKNSSPCGSQNLGAIGCERKSSLSASSSISRLDINEKTETNISPNTKTKISGTVGSEKNEKKKKKIKSDKDSNISPSEPAIMNSPQTATNNFVESNSGERIESSSFSYETKRIMMEICDEKYENLTTEEKKNDTDDSMSNEVSTNQNALDSKYLLESQILTKIDSANITDENILEETEIIPKKENIEAVFNYKDISEYLNPQNVSDESSNEESLAVTQKNLAKDIIVDSEIKSSELSDFSSANKSSEIVKIDSTDFPIGNSDAIKDAKVDEATKAKTDESVETTQKIGTFGTFLNMLKTSILGSAEGTSSDVKYENLEESSGSSFETISSSSIEKNSNLIDDQNNETVDSPSALKKLVEDFVEEIVPIISEELEIDDKDEKDSSKDAQHVNDNINSISWRESPFPIDVSKIPQLPLTDIEKKTVLQSDASTNTTNYDFNVDYVGGTSEPGYRELVAINRSINEGHNGNKIMEPPLKLMLDKSSMTRKVDILSTEANSPDDKDKDSTDRIHELVELFPNIPIDHLTAFYKDQCKGDFGWTVEMLLEGVPTDFTIKDLADKRSIVYTDDSSSTSVDIDKKRNIDGGKLKQKFHNSSARTRRQRSKDFRYLSLDNIIDYRNFSGENPVDDKDTEILIKERDYYEILFDQTSSTVETKISDVPEASSSSTASVSTENDDEIDDIIELDLGRKFVVNLEETMGNKNFVFPDEFKPTIRVKKSMAEKLHALWIQSMYEQLNERHAKLDEMIAKDEEMARAMALELNVQPARRPVEPNLEEIMEMEMARARYQNELKEKIAKETPNDIASRLSRSSLHELFPEFHPEILSELLNGHGGNFKQTCETISSSTGRKIDRTDTLKKQQNLLDFAKEENKNREIKENRENNDAPLIPVRPETNSGTKDDKLSYKAALARGQVAKDEAEKQLSLRMEYLKKAAEAYRKGQSSVAAYYSDMAKLHADRSAVAHEEAVDAFASSLARYGGNTLDLHYLYVSEARKALDIFLEYQFEKLAKSDKKKATLFIITGRGARSSNGQSRIKPAVSKILNSQNIRFTEANAGCLEVTLSKKNGILK